MEIIFCSSPMEPGKPDDLYELEAATVRHLGPQSVWLDKDSLSDNPMAAVMERLQVFGSSPVIVKDYVKSEKHRWAEACFIPDPSDCEHAQRVVLKFLELRGSNLEGGLVLLLSVS